MSFSYSQSLLGDISSSYPAPLSQELDDSQDSGYSVTLPQKYFHQPPPPAPLPFPPRRTLPCPPTWQNLQQSQQGGSKWRFGGGRQEAGRAPLERDLQHHLKEISGQVSKVPGKVSIMVEESVKYLQQVYSKEAISRRDEVKMMEKALSVLEDEMKAKDTGSGEMKEDIIAMETGLAECAALAEAVTGRRKGMKEKLADLLHKLEREESISRRMLDEVSLARKLNSLGQVDNMARTIMMQELNTTNPVMDDQRQVSPSPSPRRLFFTKPLPSIRQLSTLPGMVAGTIQQQGGMTPATQNRGGRVEEEGGFVRSCKSVRGGLAGTVMGTMGTMGGAQEPWSSVGLGIIF